MDKVHESSSGHCPKICPPCNTHACQNFNHNKTHIKRAFGNFKGGDEWPPLRHGYKCHSFIHNVFYYELLKYL